MFLKIFEHSMDVHVKFTIWQNENLLTDVYFAGKSIRRTIYPNNLEWNLHFWYFDCISQLYWIAFICNVGRLLVIGMQTHLNY